LIVQAHETCQQRSVRFADHPDAQFVIDAHAIDAVNKDELSLRHRVDGQLNILRANVQGQWA